ncbi:MAG TPA: lysylphosphatidylglycerol synthase domain-containing protein [Gaiellaceae bacterium]
MSDSRNRSQTWRLHRLTALVVVAGVLAGAALIGLAWVAGFHKVLTGLVHPHWLWLGIAVVGEAAAYAGYTAAYAEVARAEDGAELGAPTAAALVAVGFGVFVHGGGFALDRTALQHAGLPETEARRRVLGLAVLEYAVLAPATLVAAVIVLLFHNSISPSLTVPWILGVPIGAAIALPAVRYRKNVARWRFVGASLAHALNALSLVLGILRRPGTYRLALPGTLVYWAGDIFCLWAMLHAFSAHPPPIAQLIVGYATGYALTRRALPLGGAGIVEALLPFALSWLGIALSPALLAVFAYRLVNLWLPIVPALAGLPTLRSLERGRAGSKRGTPSEHRA